ncbi:helix-turn-helix domain-containing protein [Deinococcus wulumuqiensis]|uniref:XRE family transcriptional regulator n=1 Tax=Deinococcus wulumuqiensis TaxID=980427 RepID=A0A345ILD2_9DEIO|nr:helix-turn-helix transcriptional regulator [Deinococcus wulumuqiensis]AXH00505.1 XRE family transcriptional regulator [Deinococcus wulumuqiensis]QII22398.1 helix-turn-helix domain-containing protein [Deinococcus wulumuqiensis R12]
MRRSGKTQADFAAHKGVSRQSVNPYFNGKRSLFTETGRELLDFLGLRIRLEPIDPPERK